MKIKSAIIIICLMCSYITHGQSEKLFNKYSDMDQVTSVYISKSMFEMMMPLVQTTGLKLMDMAGKIESLQVLSTENKDQGNNMRKDFGNVVTKEHEELMRVKHDKTRATFHVKKKGDNIRELLMLADTDNGFTIIKLLGDFTVQDIQDITSELSKKNGKN